MEPPSLESLRSFFERIKNAGFFERIFSWKAISAAAYDAYAEFSRLQAALAEATAGQRGLSQELEHQKGQVLRLTQDLAAERGQVQGLAGKVSEKERELASLGQALTDREDHVLRLKGDLVSLTARNEELQRRINERENEVGGLVAADRKNRELIQDLNAEVAALNARYEALNMQFMESQKMLTQLRQKDEERAREHDTRVTELTALKKQLDDDRLRLQAERDAEIHRQYEEMAQTWKRHEEKVEATLKAICQRHTIGYCGKEEFPYAGKPDNALMICDQYVIFDAKSPKNPEDLDNFPQYIRTQAEAVRKYVKAENVKKDVFLVVPANTVDYLSEFVFDMADWQVYVITHDCLEPVILALRKIEDYEFAGQLSPEDRENLCRVIGKFAHAAKRRIQIDTYFSGEFIDLLSSCDHLLPEEIKQKVVEYEMAEKMNPPIEKRKKKIPITELKHDVKVIGKEAESREIDVTAVTKDKIETIPLDKFLE